MIARRRPRPDPGPILIFTVVCGPVAAGLLLAGFGLLAVLAALAGMGAAVWAVVAVCDRGRR